jgi:hypothetical protein
VIRLPTLNNWVSQGIELQRQCSKNIKTKALIFTPLGPIGQRAIGNGGIVLMPLSSDQGQQLNQFIPVCLHRDKGLEGNAHGFSGRR